MSTKDYIIGHAGHCDYCIEIEERTDLTDIEKWEFQEKHAMDLAGE